MDNIVFCGDVNARIGSRPDVVFKNNTLQVRQTIDVKVNAHGLAFLDFLNDACCCVVNGRLCPAEFTFQSSRGMSEVDYVFVPIDVLNNISDMKIIPCTKIATDLGCIDEVTDVARLPDHCMLQFNIRCNNIESQKLGQNSESKNCDHTKKKKVARKFKSDYMQSEKLRNTLLAMINNRLRQDARQHEIDDCYSNLEQTIKSEMERCRKSGKRKNTPYKQYWTEKLSELWNEYNKSVRRVRCN